MSGILEKFAGGLATAQAAQQGQMVQQQQVQAMDKQNKLAELLGTPGTMQGLMTGDANALAAYAQATGDPMAAMKIQQQALATQGAGLSNQATRQSMDLQRKEFDMAVQQQAAQMTAQERQAAAAKTRQAVQAGMTAQTPEQWDALANQMGQPDLVGKFDLREGILSTYLSAAETFERFDEQNAAPEAYQAQSPAGKLFSDQQNMPGMPAATQTQENFRQATPEEAAQYGATAGQFGPDNRFYPIKPPTGMTIESTPGGGFRFVQGSGAGGTAQEGSPASPEVMLESIDGILNDPALETSTGILSPLQAIPGTPQKRFATRANQLEGQAFLQAFESLKGAGQITEVEGRKATQAIGRLETTQHPDDYREALTDLQGVLKAAIARRDGVATADPQTPAPPEVSQGAIPQTFIEGVGSPELAQPVWDALTPEEKALFQ